MQLEGYEVRECLHRGANCGTWRAIRTRDGAAVLVKAPLQPHPPHRVTAGLQRAFELASRGRVRGIVPALALEPYQRTVALVLADVGAVSLAKLLALGPLAPRRACLLGSRLAHCLAEIHAEGMIHKDIKPANVVVNPSTHDVRLTDFDSASLLSREDTLGIEPGRLEGTLAYMAPEQTGRMNRSLDLRSDLYALGATLYEMLTGRPPFLTEDPLEMISWHLAREPVPPHELDPAIPRVLSQIVMRLLRKDPDERYQSAAGVAADLERVEAGLSRGNLKSFVLGRRDIPSVFRVPQRLYGRADSLKALHDAFTQALAGRATGVFVTGFSGIGKSSLVNEARGPVAARRGRFAAGKFDQFERTQPYAAFLQAFRDLVRQLLSEPEGALARWRERLLAALGPNAAVLSEVVPEAALILGQAEPVAPLGGEEQEQRFLGVVRSFIKAVARAEHPLVLFLDDLQWADLPSLKLLKALLEDADTGCLLVVGAYRDNEVDRAHPLAETLRQLQRAGDRISAVHLLPLKAEDLRELTADALLCSPDEVTGLAALLDRKTGGNPFFVNQFLLTLYRKGVLFIDRRRRRWGCNLKSVQGVALTDNVVDLMLERINHLAPETRRLLQLGSCLGNSFEHRTLALVAELSPQAAALELEEALREELLLPIGESYKYAEARVTYAFLHDRVQQAAYASIPGAELEAIHARIGRLLLQAEDSGERIFECTSHLNRAHALLDREERRQLARLNLEAARKARNSTAYPVCADLLEAGLKLLEENAWEADYALAFALHLERCEIASLINQDALMEELAEQLTHRARTDLDRIRAKEVRLYSYINRIQWERVLTLGLEVLDSLGVRLVHHPQQEDVGAGIMATEGLLAGIDADGLRRLPPLQDPHIHAAQRFLKAITSAAYFTRPNLYPLVVFRMTELSVAHGNCPESTAGYVGVALVRAAFLGHYLPALSLGRVALDLVDSQRASHLAGHVVMVFNIFVRHWTEPLASTLADLASGAQTAFENGDLEYWSYCHYWHGCHSLIVGRELGPVRVRLEEVWKALHRQNQVKGRLLLHLIHLIDELAGKAEPPEGDLPESVMQEHWTAAADWNSLGYCLGFQALAAFYLGDDDGCRHRLAACDPFAAYQLGQSIQPLFLFYRALAALRQGDGEDPAVAAARERFAGWAEACPANYRHKLTLLQAEEARLAGDFPRAWELYRNALQEARDAGVLPDEALAHERFGKFILERGDDTAANAHLSEARQLYLRWGARAVAARLAREHADLDLERGPSGRAAHLTSDTVLESIDIRALLRASHAVAGVLSLDELLGQLMRLLVAHAGADRGLLVLLEEGVPRIQAELGDELEVLQGLPLTESVAPCSVLQFVLRTGQDVVIQDATRPSAFSQDPYLQGGRVRSVLSAPLSFHGRHLGAIYLENRALAAAFPADRLASVQILAAQATISIENSRQVARLQVQHEQILSERERSHREALKVRALEAHNGALASFLAIASHDLKVPVAAARFWAQALRPHSPEGLVEQVQQGITEACDRASRLIQTYLDAVRAEMGEGIRLNLQRFDLRELAAQEVAFCARGQTAGRNVTLEGPGCLLEADPERLQQVVANLLGNAVNHGGGPVVVRLVSQAERVRVEVCDQGPGLSSDVCARLFQPFAQGNPRSQGSGLGLWISRVIVEAHSGRLGVDSGNQGSTFWFEIPVRQRSE